MTIASHDSPQADPAPAPAVTDMPVLLPTREDLLERLAAELPSSGEQPTTLLVIGLLRRDDGWPTPTSTLAQVTQLFARSVRGDDWLGASGAAEFGIVLAGPTTAAEVAGARLIASITALGVPGLTAAAGYATLLPELSASEVFRRATLSLTAARRVGAGTVIRYREPV
ncbi:GGDEF domain-containing protein [Blastococcus saxobsidens]|uniref:GGDEF domain-containing protein n=1 Tax=Blastococcus saxobsidens TaxID=138336 RepID=A0A6L9W3J3_9ACTN|nr:GGDEF domain-containing protein [Blastococcus saxobsidens]NEK86548.1 GGDEF domain-containing protein [Blastococcus saxobsidens]